MSISRIFYLYIDDIKTLDCLWKNAKSKFEQGGIFIVPNLLLTMGLGFCGLKQRILRIYFTRIHFLVIGYEIIGLYSFNQVIELSIFQYSVKNYNIQQQLP